MTVAVIGGGIAGLAAAWELARPGPGTPGVPVTLIDAADRVGGWINTVPFAGVELDTAADAFLARVPAAVELARAAGLGDDLVSPGTGQAWVWCRDRLRPLPGGLVLGVPTDLRALAASGIVAPLGAARAALDLVLPGSPVGPDEDVAVGRLIRRRMGRAVQMFLLDPLVGGINAGHTDELSAAVAAPQLLAAARRQASLIRGLRPAETPPAGPAGGPPEGPVFYTVRGGMARLVGAIRAGLDQAGVSLVTGDAVTSIERHGPGWVVRCASGRTVAAAAVVVACPAGTAARLLRPHSPAAAATLAGVGAASVVLTTLAYPEAALRRPLQGSGFLVPRPAGRLLTACSWVGSKWPHVVTPGLVLFRASAGRIDDERALGMGDDEIIAACHTELVAALGLSRLPVEARVHRHPGAFPQYRVGHLERVDELERRLTDDAPGLSVAGAALRGVGIATCIAGGRRAAGRARDYAQPARSPA